ncbi:conserved Plasmodium protein, unknown function, partial [Plasmodium gallinaceum]
MNFKLKKKIEKKKNKDYKKEFCESETRIFNREVSYDTKREVFNLPKINRNGILTYDEESSTIEETKNKKKEKEKLKLKKLLENIKKKKVKKNPIEEEILKITNKINNLQDIKNIIATTANSIIADQNLNIQKLDILFYIFKESLRRKKEFHKENKYNVSTFKEKYKYFENINILSCISLCTIFKCITPSYKIFNTDDGNSNVIENNSNLNNKKKKKNQLKHSSKIIENVNQLEQTIVKYFKDFCNILKENINDNTIVYVNLLCEIVTVNLYLSKNEKLFEYLLLYSNIYTYKSKKYNKIENKRKFEILCMKCLNTLSEIIENDHNLSFTLTLVNYFSNYIFRKEKNICPNLLKIFSNINISEKKMNAKLYSDEDKNDNEGKNNELKMKTNICGDLKIIEKNSEKILDQLFLIYLCVLREYKKYSVFFVKNVLYALSNYALYINKLIMDDVLEEVKALAKENKISPSLRITSIHIFLKILNKVNDNIYIDCSWIVNCLLDLLDSSIHYFHTGSSIFLLQNRNFIYNNFLDSNNCYSNDNNTCEIDNSKNIKQMNNSLKIDKLKEKYNFSSEVLYCIDLLLKTKNFTNSFNNIKFSNNQLLCRIIYHLYNISLHSDYIISFSILKIIQFIMIKFPLVKCMIEREGIVISYINDNLSIFFQNILFHSCLFNEISSIALDISLNDSNENYNTVLKNYINVNNCNIKNKIINFNLSLNEKKIIDENILMKYDYDNIFYKHKENYNQFNINDKNNFKESIDKSFLSSNNLNENLNVNNLPPYMLTAIDFIDIVFSPYDKFIKYFQKERGKNESTINNNYKYKNYKEDRQNENQEKKYKNFNKIKKIIRKKKKKKKKKK